jgi:subtilisin family serine protease
MKKILTLSVLSILLSGCGSSDEVTIDDVVDIIIEPEIIEYDSQYSLQSINASKVYDEGYAGDGVIVAVIDTGVDINHPDLIDNISTDSYDFIDRDNDASPNVQGTNMSHGTHVAGIIAGMKNGIGIQGVAYNSKILALRASKSSGFMCSDCILSAIDRAIDKGAKVINASFGSGEIDKLTADRWLLAHNADIVSVHAAGNDKQIEPDYGAKLPAIGGYEELASTLIAVVATDENNKIAYSYSNRCGVAKDWCMAAPGSNIVSTVDMTDTTDTNGDGYESYYGTSMAAPHVSGAVAVLRSKWPSKSAAETVGILYDTATDLGLLVLMQFMAEVC